MAGLLHARVQTMTPPPNNSDFLTEHGLLLGGSDDMYQGISILPNSVNRTYYDDVYLYPSNIINTPYLVNPSSMPRSVLPHNDGNLTDWKQGWSGYTDETSLVRHDADYLREEGEYYAEQYSAPDIYHAPLVAATKRLSSWTPYAVDAEQRPIDPSASYGGIMPQARRSVFQGDKLEDGNRAGSAGRISAQPPADQPAPYPFIDARAREFGTKLQPLVDSLSDEPAVRARPLPPLRRVPGFERNDILEDGTIVVTARTRHRLGELSAEHESGGDPGRISSGRNDPGGVSYGLYQLTTNRGGAAAFVASPEFRPWARDFQNLEPGTPAFGAQWQAAARRDPTAFADAQHAYIRRTHYDPAVNRVFNRTGYEFNAASGAVRDVGWAVSVQHGGAATILADAVQRTDRTFRRDDPNYERTLIDNIFRRRTEYLAVLRDRAAARNERGNVRTFSAIMRVRYPAERAQAQRMLLNEHRR